VPKTGWAIVTKEEFDVADAKQKGLVYHPRGLHGYDHEHPLMRAIFVARGPAFPHEGNSRVEPFRMFLLLTLPALPILHLTRLRHIMIVDANYEQKILKSTT
jgi:hypothetical protein